MTTIDRGTLEALLRSSESETLDFKRDQYLIEGASDDDKSKFVKDILAFANAWKTGPAHIVVGVEDGHGGRGSVVGVAKHVDDASLQEIVNSKTNVPVRFTYIATTIDEKPIAVIRIEHPQQRPIFLKKDFGTLKKEMIYVRRSSSTAVAPLDEVLSMRDAAKAPPAPSLELSFGNPSTRESIGVSIEGLSILLEDPPPISAEQRAEIAKLHREMGIGSMVEQIGSLQRAMAIGFPSGPDPKKMKAYRRIVARLNEIEFFVRNTGAIVAIDTRVLAKIEKRDGLELVDELPEKPPDRSLGIMASIGRLPALRRETWVRVSDRGDHWEIDARIGKVQPGAVRRSDSFWIGATRDVQVTFDAQIFADNISGIAPLPMSIDLKTRRKYDRGEDIEAEDDSDDA